MFEYPNRVTDDSRLTAERRRRMLDSQTDERITLGHVMKAVKQKADADRAKDIRLKF